MANKGNKPKKRIRIRFRPNGFQIYEKEVIFENQKFNIKMDVKPHNLGGPTVEVDSRVPAKENE